MNSNNKRRCNPEYREAAMKLVCAITVACSYLPLRHFARDVSSLLSFLDSEFAGDPNWKLFAEIYYGLIIEALIDDPLPVSLPEPGPSVGVRPSVRNPHLPPISEEEFRQFLRLLEEHDRGPDESEPRN